MIHLSPLLAGKDIFNSLVGMNKEMFEKIRLVATNIYVYPM